MHKSCIESPPSSRRVVRKWFHPNQMAIHPSENELHTLAWIAAIALFEPEGYIRILFRRQPHLQALPLRILHHCSSNRHIERRKSVGVQRLRSLWLFPLRRKMITRHSIEQSVRPRVRHDGARQSDHSQRNRHPEAEHIMPVPLSRSTTKIAAEKYGRS